MIKHVVLLFIFLSQGFLLKTVAQERIVVGTAQEDLANGLAMYNDKYYIFGTTRVDAQKAKDYYLVILGSNGSVEKSMIYGFNKHDVGNQVLADEQGIFVIGSAYDFGYPNVDMHLVKLNENGEGADWEKFYGTQYQELGLNLIRTRSGGFAMIGFSNTQLDGGDLFCVKTDEKGDTLWQRMFGPPKVDYGFSLVENDKEEIVFAGVENGFYNPTQSEFERHPANIMLVKTDKNGNEIWLKTYGGEQNDWCKDIINAPDGGYYLCGSTQSFGAGSFDVFLMKIDDDGNEIWMKTFGGPEFEYGEKLQLSADGNIYISASSASFSENLKPDHFIIKTDQFGNKIWSRVLGTEGSDYSSGLVATPDSGVVFTGWSTVGEKGKTDFVFYKLSKDGESEIISSIYPSDSVTSVLISPNPAGEVIHVEVISPLTGKLDFVLYDAQGRKIVQKKIEVNTKNEIRKRNRSGIYIYQIIDKNEILTTGKLIIK